MKLYYTSRGELAFLTDALAPALPDKEGLDIVLERVRAGKEDPDFVKVSVLSGADIKSLVKKCDPAYFLYLRDLSVSMLADYKRRAEGLSHSGYINEERVCIRFAEDASAIQLLAAGICARASGVSDIVFSMARGSFSQEHAAACRLAGVETVWLCDSVECAVRAAFGSRLSKSCDALVGRDDSPFEYALSLLSGVLHTESLPSATADGAIFLLSDGTSLSVAAADMKRLSCRYPNRTYIAITDNEKVASELKDRCDGLEGAVVVTSSFAESCAVLGKLPALRTFVYGNAEAREVRADAVCANEASPLQLASALPSVFYPYTPLLFSRRRPEAALPFAQSVTAFASSLAPHVSRGCLSDEDMTCIAARLEELSRGTAPEPTDKEIGGEEENVDINEV